MLAINGYTTLDAALYYAVERGWPIYPVKNRKPLTDDPAPCFFPRLDVGLEDRETIGSLDEEEIRGWWDRYRPTGLAVKTGSGEGKAGVFALSFRGDFEHKLEALQERKGELPDTLAAHPAGRPGLDLFFDADFGAFDVHTRPVLFEAEGLRGYIYGGCWGIVAPPSISEGRKLEWMNDLEPAQSPAWLTKIACPEFAAYEAAKAKARANAAARSKRRGRFSIGIGVGR